MYFRSAGRGWGEGRYYDFVSMVRAAPIIFSFILLCPVATRDFSYYYSFRQRMIPPPGWITYSRYA